MKLDVDSNEFLKLKEEMAQLKTLFKNQREIITESNLLIKELVANSSQGSAVNNVTQSCSLTPMPAETEEQLNDMEQVPNIVSTVG
jgi:hypothetical protein